MVHLGCKIPSLPPILNPKLMHICHGSFGVNRNEKSRDFQVTRSKKNSGPKEKEEGKTKSNHITHIKEETIIKFQLKQLQ